MGSFVADIEFDQGSRPEQILARLEDRLSPLHLRQRLGIERDHDRTFGHGARPFDLEDTGFARALFCTTLKVTGLHWLGSRNADRIEVRKNRVLFPHLPEAFDGLTILHISDLHADMSTRALRRLTEILPSLHYDVCVLTGDYRGETFGPFDRVLKEMAVLRRFLRGPVYGVLGNHDSIRMVPPLEDMGIRMLLNESVALHRGSDRLHLAGIDDAHFYQAHNFEKASAEVGEREFSVLLSHTPEVYRQAAHAGFDLFLAGHTHGGQICLPGSHAIVLESQLPRRLGAGPWTYHQMAGYTSVGVGCCIVAVRINCPPEITLHQLKRA